MAIEKPGLLFFKRYTFKSIEYIHFIFQAASLLAALAHPGHSGHSGHSGHIVIYAPVVYSLAAEMQFEIYCV
ncbi:hypothetical protein XIS1_1340026 [Xenorhabdus innexi]|uniref:Uncharacterized protein n=1 Tax=Xenorhabdus innexi TaxID=290109 RepID=A0A1N6MTC2_9GAMM|nr:hypothetical protein XIS1_1340026 [Xenorhabdus innexi]